MLSFDDNHIATKQPPAAPPAGGPIPNPTTVTSVALSEKTTGAAGVTGLEEIVFNAARIKVDEKRIINCRADLNQLVPFKYEWAWQKYLDACATIGCLK